MSQSRLFLPNPLTANARLELGREQAHYLGRVLRKRVGDTLTVFDGSGYEYEAEIHAFGRERAVIEVGDRSERNVESPLRIRLLQCVSRGERMDFAIQKATELGASEIQPIISERTVVRLSGKRAKRRSEHWQRVAASACEQCGRNRVPEVHESLALAEVLGRSSDATLRLMLAPGGSAGIRDLTPSGQGFVELLIGPEGGLSDNEIAAAGHAGFVACRMGPRILRTETAGVAALAVMQAEWGDL